MGETAQPPGVDAPPLDIDAMAADAMARINKYINYSSAAHLRAILKTLRAADHHNSKKVPQQANPALHFARRAPNPFVWRTAGMDPRPLNADIKRTVPPKNHGGRTIDDTGTIKGLSKRADKILEAKALSALTNKILAIKKSSQMITIHKKVETHRVRTIDGKSIQVEVRS